MSPSEIESCAHSLTEESVGAQVDEKKSAEGRTRTADTRIFSPVLYHLSYLGKLRQTLPGVPTKSSGGDDGI